MAAMIGVLSRPLRASRDMVLVSVLSVAAQALVAASQFVFAAIFGASADSDAFFAALSPPLYVTTVLVASLSVVFLPIFVERRAAHRSREAPTVARGALNAVGLPPIP